MDNNLKIEYQRVYRNFKAKERRLKKEGLTLNVTMPKPSTLKTNTQLNNNIKRATVINSRNANPLVSDTKGTIRLNTFKNNKKKYNEIMKRNIKSKNNLYEPFLDLGEFVTFSNESGFYESEKSLAETSMKIKQRIDNLGVKNKINGNDDLKKKIKRQQDNEKKQRKMQKLDKTSYLNEVFDNEMMNNATTSEQQKRVKIIRNKAKKFNPKVFTLLRDFTFLGQIKNTYKRDGESDYDYVERLLPQLEAIFDSGIADLISDRLQ